MAESRYLSTPQVADALGVSVTTVKRWVDDGVLPAHKTAGGHRKLLMDDVLRLIRETNLPQADVSRLCPRTRPTNDNLATVRDQFLAALRTPDHDLVKTLLDGAYRQGVSVAQLADEVVGPCLATVGHDWESGRISVMQEHRATQAVVAALYELRGRLKAHAHSDRDRPVAVGGAPEQDPSVVPTLLAKLVLLDSGWEAINLGPQTPLAAFRSAIAELSPRLIWVCATHLTDPESFLRDYTALYSSAHERGIAVAVGGRALTAELRQRMPYTNFGDGMSHLSAFAHSLHRPVGVPKKGRPTRVE